MTQLNFIVTTGKAEVKENIITYCLENNVLQLQCCFEKDIHFSQSSKQ